MPLQRLLVLACPLACVRHGRMVIRYANNQFVEIAIQCFADQVEVLETDPLRYLVVQLSDGVRPNARGTCEVRLGESQFSEFF